VDVYDPQRNLQIDTPENLLLEAEIAGFGSRCAAAIFDYLYLVFGLIAVTWVFSRVFDFEGSDSSWGLAAFTLLQFAVISFYHLFFEFVWNGQTPGKRRVGIRVVQTNGMPLSASAVLVRNLVRLFDFFPVFYGAGLVVMFASKNAQRLGDMAAGTVVVRERETMSLHDLGENLMLIYRRVSLYRPLPEYIKIDNLTIDDRREIVSYLQRRDEFIRTEHLVMPLARRIAEKVGTPEAQQAVQFPYPEVSETFLEQIALAFEVAEVEKQNAESPAANG